MIRVNLFYSKLFKNVRAMIFTAKMSKGTGNHSYSVSPFLFYFCPW